MSYFCPQMTSLQLSLWIQLSIWMYTQPLLHWGTFILYSITQSFLSWGNVYSIQYFLYLDYMTRWPSSFILLEWCIMSIDLYALNHPWILGTSPPHQYHVPIPHNHVAIKFILLILMRILHPSSPRILVCICLCL